MVGMGISQVSVLSWSSLCLMAQMALKATQMKPQVGGCWAGGARGPALDKGLSASLHLGAFHIFMTDTDQMQFFPVFPQEFVTVGIVNKD